jgi:hypothetical protein
MLVRLSKTAYRSDGAASKFNLSSTQGGTKYGTALYSFPHQIYSSSAIDNFIDYRVDDD